MAKESGGKILSRREFIKGAALGTTAVGLAALGITYESLKVEASPENLRIGPPEMGRNGLSGGYGVLSAGEFNKLVKERKLRPGSGIIAEHLSSENLPKKVSYEENIPEDGTSAYLGIEVDSIAAMELYRTLRNISTGDRFWKEGSASDMSESPPLTGARNPLYPIGMEGEPYDSKMYKIMRAVIKHGYCSNALPPSYYKIASSGDPRPSYPTTNQIAEAEANPKPGSYFIKGYGPLSQPEELLVLFAEKPGIMLFPVYKNRQRFVNDGEYLTLYQPEPGETSPYKFPLLVFGYDEEYLFAKKMAQNRTTVRIPYGDGQYFDAIQQTHAPAAFYYWDLEGQQSGPTPTPTSKPTDIPTATPEPVDSNKVIFIPIALHAALGLQE